MALATERFDRRDGRPVPLESLYSTLFVATAGKMSSRWSEEGTKPSFEMVGAFLHEPKVQVTVDREADAKEFFKRVVLNVLIGNSDMHLENFAFLGGRGQSRLSPVYDPAPTRGYASLQCVSVVSFGNLATATKSVPPQVGEALLRLHAAFRVQQPRMLAIVEECLEATSDYADLIRASGAKEHVVTRLLSRLEGTRYRVEAAWKAARPSIQLPAHQKVEQKEE